MQGVLVDTRSGRRRSFRWSSGAIKFGSGVDADLVLHAPDIASKHGTFQLSPQGCRVTVDGDALPVELNGVATRDGVIQIGDVVRIGPFQLAFADAAAASPTAKTATLAAPPPAAPVAPPPSVRAPARDAGSRGGVYGDAGSSEERARKSSARARAKVAGQGANPEGMKVVAILTGLIAVGVIGFLFFGGSAWKHLGDGSGKDKAGAIRILIKNCELAEAERRTDKLWNDTDNEDARAEVMRLKKEIAAAKAHYAEGQKELADLKQKAATMKPESFERLANLFINKYMNGYEPLCKEMDKVLAAVKSGTFTPPPPPPEEKDTADYSSKGAVPGFESRDKKKDGEN